ncbi:MAG TPA: LacI family DNA-binding transcriptional regulator [Chthoniobacterales bacterium]
MQRVTIKDIAEAVGLSVSCTARALKGRPDISRATCRRVSEMAERMGYAPDPILGALAAYRQSRKPAQFRGTLAFVTPFGSEKSCLAGWDFGDLLRGARARAEALGYSLDYFNLADARKHRRGIEGILRARGIRGVLIRSIPKTIREISFPFDRFMCVNLFSEPHASILSTVSSHHAQSMELVLSKLKERGCRHPALVIHESLSELIHHGWWTTFAVYGSQFENASVFTFDDKRMPLFARDLARHRQAVASLNAWARERRVDALIYGSSEHGIPTAHKRPEWRARNIPHVVSLDLSDPDCGLCGIYQDRFQASAVAVDWLQAQMLTERADIQPPRIAIMVPGRWIEGAAD